MSQLDQEPSVRRMQRVLKVSPAAAEASTGADRAAQEAKALAAFQRGERDQALSLLMDLYGRTVYRYCCHVVRDPVLAEDLLQTVFLQAFRDISGFQGRSSLRTWVMGIAHHRCLDAIKSRRRREQVLLSDEAPPDSGGTEDLADHLHLSRSLESCLGELEARVRDAVLLRHFEGFSYREMEHVCAEKAATLQMRVARALPILRRCLESKGVQL